MDNTTLTGNEPLHPTDIWVESKNGGFYQEGTDKGITVRAHFASLAMQGMLCQRGDVDRLLNEGNQSLTKSIAAASVIVADALIAALNSKP